MAFFAAGQREGALSRFFVCDGRVPFRYPSGMKETPLTDAVGTVHEPAGADARIVCLVPSITELIVELGLAGQLVGRTQWCIHPADVVANIPAVGGTKKVNLDKLRSLSPTHVVLNIDENTRAMADAIKEFVPNVIVTHPNEPADNYELFLLMGEVFGKEREAIALCAAFDEAVQALGALSESLPWKEVLYLIWKDPWMTVSRDTYIAGTLQLVNWMQIPVGDERYPRVEITPSFLEGIDLVLFSSEPYSFGEEHLREFSDTYDCPMDKLHLIDGEMTSWYGSRAIRGLRYLGAFAAGVDRG
jgi:ABC-type Fe3+-hydroxamate transport system substrate-binding protein